MFVVLINDARTTGSPSSTTRVVIIAVLGAAAALLITLQVIATRSGFQGPLLSLVADYVATPKSASVPWAGLALALVGISTRHRVMALTAAIGIDLVFAAERLLRGGAATVGNGPLIVLTALALIAWLRWTGKESARALHAIALGALLIIATKVGDTWLQITGIARPTVLDQYAQLADQALGNPSWVLGRMVEAMGPVGYGILHWVYIELPVAAIVVAVWQLRRVSNLESAWPQHYLVRTFLTLGLIGPIIYVLFPVVGPIFAYGADGQGLQLSNYWPDVAPPFTTTPGAMPFDDFTPRNCMPSMHTAWAMAVFIHSRRGPRWLRYGGTFWLVCTLTATLGFGYHYGVDLVAGAVLCLTVESALREPGRGWGWFRVRLVVGGAVGLIALLFSYRYLAVWIAEYPAFSGPLILGVLAAMIAAFYATWFARPGTLLATWGRREVVAEPAAS